MRLLQSIAVLAVVCIASTLVQAQAPAKHTSNLARAGKVAAFPMLHPVKTLKGVLYGFLVGIGSAADVVEKVTGSVAAGAKRVDDFADQIEQQVDPTPNGAKARAASKAKRRG